MSNFSTDDDESLGEMLSEYNDNFYEDASESFESDDFQVDLNRQLEIELNLEDNQSHELYDDFEYLIKKETQLNNLDLTIDNNKFLLKKLAKSKYGLLNNRIRKKAWPILIENSLLNDINFYKKLTQDDVMMYRDFNQVKLDVVRTLKRFPPQISNDLRAKLQDKLIDNICKILIKHDDLNYYQGYHDICLTFLLVMGVDDCIPLLSQITKTHLTSFMERTMEKTIRLLSNLMPLIHELNSSVAYHIHRAELGVMFALSWLITWYSHVIDDISIILRLYDLFIVTNPMMPVYVAAIIVCERSDEILDIECDMASLHTVITKYASEINSLEKIEIIIQKALELYDRYPVNILSKLNEKWKEKCKLNELKENQLIQRQQQQQLLYNNNKRKLKNNNDRKLMKSKNYGIILGLTIAVASAAIYAYSPKVMNNPELLINKVYQILYN